MNEGSKCLVSVATKERLSGFYWSMSIYHCHYCYQKDRHPKQECVFGKTIGSVIYNRYIIPHYSYPVDGKNDFIYTLYKINSKSSDDNIIKYLIDEIFQDEFFKVKICNGSKEQLKTLILFCNIYSEIEKIIDFALSDYNITCKLSRTAKDALTELTSILEPISCMKNSSLDRLIFETQSLNPKRLIVNIFDFVANEFTPCYIYGWDSNELLNAFIKISKELEIDSEILLKGNFLL